MLWTQAGATLHCLTQGQNRTLRGPVPCPLSNSVLSLGWDATGPAFTACSCLISLAKTSSIMQASKRSFFKNLLPTSWPSICLLKGVFPGPRDEYVQVLLLGGVSYIVYQIQFVYSAVQILCFFVDILSILGSRILKFPITIVAASISPLNLFLLHGL